MASSGVRLAHEGSLLGQSLCFLGFWLICFASNFLDSVAARGAGFCQGMGICSSLCSALSSLDFGSRRKPLPSASTASLAPFPEPCLAIAPEFGCHGPAKETSPRRDASAFLHFWATLQSRVPQALERQSSFPKAHQKDLAPLVGISPHGDCAVGDSAYGVSFIPGSSPVWPNWWIHSPHRVSFSPGESPPGGDDRERRHQGQGAGRGSPGRQRSRVFGFPLAKQLPTGTPKGGWFKGGTKGHLGGP